MRGYFLSLFYHERAEKKIFHFENLKLDNETKNIWNL